MGVDDAELAGGTTLGRRQGMSRFKVADGEIYSIIPTADLSLIHLSLRKWQTLHKCILRVASQR